MTATSESLHSLRKKIDSIDLELLDLLNLRFKYALQIGDLKRQTDSAEIEIYRPDREAVILKRLKDRNHGPIPDDTILSAFKEIISLSRHLETELSVATLGPIGTYTELAAYKHFGKCITTIPASTIEDIFTAVDSGQADFGVAPVENSSEGSINSTLDQLVSTNLIISGEIQYEVRHALLARKGSAIGNINKVYAHSQSLAQCRRWLEKNLYQAEKITTSSNAEAAQLASEDGRYAAIASPLAAKQYDLTTLATRIEDDYNNTTRFLVFGKYLTEPSGLDKTSLILSAKHEPGSLFALLEPLSKSNISMTKIESRPSRKGLWEYFFFVDIEGHQADPKIANCLQNLKRNARYLKILGSYPKAI